MDSNGYALVALFTDQSVSIFDSPPSSPVPRYSGSAWSTVGGHVDSLYSAGGGSAAPIRLVACDDTLPLVNHLFACSFL